MSTEEQAVLATGFVAALLLELGYLTTHKRPKPLSEESWATLRRMVTRAMREREVGL